MTILYRLLLIATLSLASCAAPHAAPGRPSNHRAETTQPFVIAANPLAARAGIEVLKRGGSAVDAAIAVQAMLSLVEPQSSGLGGGAFMTYYDGGTRGVSVYDGRETAPAQASPGMFLGPDGKPLPFGEAVLSGSGLDVTLLRPSVIFGAEDKFLNIFAQLQQLFPVIPLASSAARFQPVWVEDVASAVLRCLEDTSTIGKIFEACGPEVFTLKQLVELSGQWAGVNGGRGRPVFDLPGPLARIQARLMELAPGEPVMSRDNLDAMKVDNVASGQLPGLDALGITPSALRAIAPSYLDARGLRSGLTAKRKTAGRF